MATATEQKYGLNEVVSWANTNGRKVTRAEILEPANLRGQSYDFSASNPAMVDGPLKIALTFEK